MSQASGSSGVEASVSIEETSDLGSRMALIKLEMRYKLTLVLGSMVRSFMPNIKKGHITFETFLNTLLLRLEMAARFNHQTRKLFFAQQLFYDFESIFIPDTAGGSREVTLNHAILVVSIKAKQS